MRIRREDSISPRRFGDLPQEFQTLFNSLLDGIKTALRENLHGVYLYGAIVFPESRYIQDIDFHVTLKRPMTAAEKEEIKRLHKVMVDRFPPLGAELDGYYILVEDARQSTIPGHQVYPDITDEDWALHRAHMLAGYCIVLYGPSPEQVFPAPSWAELVPALTAALRHTEKYVNKYPDYCILNLCRLVYSYSTKNAVVSKRTAAEWAIKRFADWKHLIEAALRVYEREGEEGDRQLLESEIERFYQFACDRIEESKA